MIKLEDKILNRIHLELVPEIIYPKSDWSLRQFILCGDTVLLYFFHQYD